MLFQMTLHFTSGMFNSDNFHLYFCSINQQVTLFKNNQLPGKNKTFIRDLTELFTGYSCELNMIIYYV